jgi:hypothetical protein
MGGYVEGLAAKQRDRWLSRGIGGFVMGGMAEVRNGGIAK